MKTCSVNFKILGVSGSEIQESFCNKYLVTLRQEDWTLEITGRAECRIHYEDYGGHGN
jgi:hypothetical protein